MNRRMSALLLALSLTSASACRKAVSDADSARTRGVAYMDKGEYDLAIQQFDTAIELKPDDADSYNSRGNAYASKHDPDRAIASFDTAIQIRPNFPFAFKNRGVTYSAKDSFDHAIRDLDQAIKLKPDYAGAFNSRGFAHQLKGEYEDAVQDYDRSIELAPESAPTYRNRANSRFILGRFADAASDLERSVKFRAAITAPGARFDETGGYAVVWLHVARMRDGQDDAKEFATNSARIDSTYWPRPVDSFFEGKLTADQLVAQTASVADLKLRNDQRCGAEFFAGQAAMWKMQPVEAKKRFETVTTTCSKRFTEHAAALADLDRLGASTK